MGLLWFFHDSLDHEYRCAFITFIRESLLVDFLRRLFIENGFRTVEISKFYGGGESKWSPVLGSSLYPLNSERVFYCIDCTLLICVLTVYYALMNAYVCPFSWLKRSATPVLWLTGFHPLRRPPLAMRLKSRECWQIAGPLCLCHWYVM